MLNKIKETFNKHTTELGRVDREALYEDLEALESEGIVASVPRGINDVLDNMDEDNLVQVADNMINAYMNWMDEIADVKTGNIASNGWRTAMLDELQKYGYNFGDTRITENALAEDEHDQYDKIYSLGSFEQLPDERLSPQARAILHSISNPTPNRLGLYVNYNGDMLYRQAIKTVQGAIVTGKQPFVW